MKSCLLEYATVFPIKNKFELVILAFCFDLVLPFYFLKWNRLFSTFIPVLSERVTTSNGYLSREVFTNLQVKKIFASEALLHNLKIRGFNLQVKILKSPHLKSIIFGIAWVENYF